MKWLKKKDPTGNLEGFSDLKKKTLGDPGQLPEDLQRDKANSVRLGALVFYGGGRLLSRVNKLFWLQTQRPLI